MKHSSPDPASVVTCLQTILILSTYIPLWRRAPDTIIVKQPKKASEEVTDFVCRAVFEQSPLQTKQPHNEQ